MTKKVSLAMLLLASTLSLGAIADEIPKAFHGKWATNATICTSKGPEAEAIVTVDRKGYQGYEVSCRVKKIKTSTSAAMAASGACDEEGTSSPASLTLELIDDGKALKISGEKYVRCGVR